MPYEVRDHGYATWDTSPYGRVEERVIRAKMPSDSSFRINQPPPLSLYMGWCYIMTELPTGGFCRWIFFFILNWYKGTYSILQCLIDPSRVALMHFTVPQPRRCLKIQARESFYIRWAVMRTLLVCTWDQTRYFAFLFIYVNILNKWKRKNVDSFNPSQQFEEVSYLRET